MGEPWIYATGSSECCGAPVWDDVEICSNCKEHCTRAEDDGEDE